MTFLTKSRELWARLPEVIKIILKFWGIGILITVAALAVIYFFIALNALFGDGFTIFMVVAAIAGAVSYGVTKL